MPVKWSTFLIGIPKDIVYSGQDLLLELFMTFTFPPEHKPNGEDTNFLSHPWWCPTRQN